MYRLNIIIKEYIENHKELINTHRQYLEVNKAYHDNVTSYMSSMINSNNTANEIAANILSNQINNTTTQNTPSQDTSSQDTPSQDTSSQDTSSQDTSSQDTSSQDTPSHDTSSQDTPSHDTSSQDTPSHDTPTQDTSSQDTSSQDTSSQDTSSQDTSSQDTSISYVNIPQTRTSEYRRLNGINRRRQLNQTILNSNTHSPRRNENSFTSTYILPNIDISDDISNISVPDSIINQECEILPYNSINTSQDICPIDRVPFEDNENVMRIRFCGHIFREENLRENFRSRPTCPVCRHNIVTTITHNQRYNVNDHFASDIEWFVRY